MTAVWMMTVQTVVAQRPRVHFEHAGAMPPGAIGSQQLRRGGPLPGYFQPVEVKGPPGALISTAENGGFQPPAKLPSEFGMLIGAVYRFRITGIPEYEGLEVYPTVEVIDRIYPPIGYERKFPITIELTQDELEMALDGKFVTRVIYLEEPDTAVPVGEDPIHQSFFEIGIHENPLEVADRLGRPAAILRMGGRLPEAGGPDMAFLYGCPPIGKCAAPPPQPELVPIARREPTGAIEPEKIAALPIEPIEGYGRPIPRMVVTPWKPPGIACPWPHDEWIHDGGDKDVRVNLTREPAVRGLDLEDTVVHYNTANGCLRIEPSNRVHIYSPRFMAVRKVSNVSINHQAERLVGAVQPVRLVVYDERQLADAATQPVQPIADVGTKQLSISRIQEPAGRVVRRQMVAALSGGVLPFENLSIIKFGIFEHEDKALLAERVQAAITWSRDQAVQVVIDGRKAVEHVSDQKAQVTFTVDLPDNPCLRVVKIASSQVARPGDIVDFTIRFDNTGDQVLTNVTLLDNLTTRLEYVPDSAQASREAEFNTQRNEGDSLVLRWDFAEPLKPGDGGLVRFKCRVR
jgi:uncharacterized repeat protein (TIGR01451 family)